jgi:hypothetical protein
MNPTKNGIAKTSGSDSGSTPTSSGYELTLRSLTLR